MPARDAWIGWSDQQRRGNLQLIVNHGGFLVLPWVRVKGLASKILAMSARHTNWIHVGQAAGRGRMDREHKAQDGAVKDICVYPLARHARQLLCRDHSDSTR
jgi:hypothetical protein